jgi:aryl-alcohol dehydrogenase-like predicted oxidoreductase
VDRRELLQAFGAIALTAVTCSRSQAAPAVGLTVAQSTAAGDVPRRALGKTGASVSILALGGFHLGSVKDEKEATRIVHEGMDAGVDFFDNAWEYHDGLSEERLGRALAGGRRDKAFVMTKVCTHGRGADVAMQQLEDSLRRLRTDHLDLWQVHECIYENDPELHFAPEGVITALEKAKRQGKTRFVGFTGHKDPRIHLKMLAHGFSFDTCQLPINCFDATFRSFEQQVFPELARRGIAALGMKSLGGTGTSVAKGAVRVDEALRYALSTPVAAVVSGIDSIQVLRQNLAIVRAFRPMTPDEMQALSARCAQSAADGRFELYKTTAYFDGAVGREQHGYPRATPLG